MRRFRAHLTYANVMVTLLAFVVFAGGAAYAANTVFSSDIVDGEVKTNDLAASAVASGKIADQQVKNQDLGLGASSSNTIADGGVQGIDVKDNTLKGADIDESTLSNIGGGGPAGGDLFGTYPNPTIKANAVGGGKVADESLTLADIKDESLTGHDIQDNTIGGADVNESLLDYGVSVASFSSHDPANFELGVDTQVISLTDGRSGGLLSVPFNARLIVTASVTVHLFSESSAFCQARIAPAGGSYSAISQYAFLRPIAADYLGSIPISAGADIGPGTYNVQIVCTGEVTGTAEFERADLTAVATSR
jgi:hypothetical protein